MRFKPTMRTWCSGAMLALACYAVLTDAQTDLAPGTLVEGPGKPLVQAHCSACHSLALVTQNRGDAEHWTRLIRWMQAEHKLWDLGPAEAPLVAYLATHYGAPANPPRRQPLQTQWREASD